VECGEGVLPLPTGGDGWVGDFGSQIGEFRCKLGAFCTEAGYAVPTVKITLEMSFPGVPAGNDPCSRDHSTHNICSSIVIN